MLFGYPMAAARCNWFHDWLCGAIGRIHEELEAGGQVPSWRDLVPCALRGRLEHRRGLRDRLEAYVSVVGRMGPEERARILRALVEQNDIEGLVSCASDCEAIDDLAAGIREPARELFRFAFELLTALGIRDIQYVCIFESVRSHVCPFCGCEYFDAPGAVREPLDHYLSLSRYPFAGANLENLVPMGEKCNSRYKRAQDVLRGDGGSRRRSFFPYGEVPAMSVCLDGSIPFAGVGGEVPLWDIQFDNSAEEVDTWLEVFSIRERYARDVLDEGFKRWLGEFSMWCRANPLADGENETIIDAVRRYAVYLCECGLSDRAFLKSAVFRMVHRWCREGNERLLGIVRGLVGIGWATGAAW